jgi:uncharacterized protein YdgA (DUF945 family)
MNEYTIITAIIVLGIVWGGVAFFMGRALKYEREKEHPGEE